MPEQSEALENNNEKAVAKVKIDLKATKAKAPENKKSVDFVVPNHQSLVLKPNSDSTEISPTPPPPLIQVPQPNLAASTTNGTSNQVCPNSNLIDENSSNWRKNLKKNRETLFTFYTLFILTNF